MNSYNVMEHSWGWVQNNIYNLFIFNVQEYFGFCFGNPLFDTPYNKLNECIQMRTNQAPPWLCRTIVFTTTDTYSK